MKGAYEAKKASFNIVGDLVSVIGIVLGLYSLIIASTNIYYILSVNNYYIYFILMSLLLVFLGYKYAIKFIVSEKTPKYYIFKTFGILLTFSLILKFMLSFIKVDILFTIFDISTLLAIMPIPFIIGELLAIYSTDVVNHDKKKRKNN